MRKYDRQDHKAIAVWAAECAERVLPLFEKAYPNDDRPRKAIEALRTWIGTGVFKMATIRGASLSAHAAAKDAKENAPACFAAHAAGQAVATAHVPQHAFGASYYALRAAAAADPEHAASATDCELEWQLQRTPKNLREEIRKRMLIQESRGKITIKVHRDEDY